MARFSRIRTRIGRVRRAGARRFSGLRKRYRSAVQRVSYRRVNSRSYKSNKRFRKGLRRSRRVEKGLNFLPFLLLIGLATAFLWKPISQLFKKKATTP